MLYMPGLVSPLYDEKISTKNGYVLIWKISSLLIPKKASARISFQRKIILSMLKASGYDVNRLYYKSTGQPLISSDSQKHISVSHSQNWFVIYLSDDPVGVDIEVERPSIISGKDWFINQSESSKYQTCQMLHLVWGAKEAYYKKNEGQIADLKNEVSITEINKTRIKINYQNTNSQLFYKVIQNVYLVWT